MNTITDLLDLEDSDITISDILIEGNKKYLTLETPPSPHFCPSCGFRMYSKGINKRTISHPVLQDGFELILLLKQRRWRCTNQDCNYTVNDSFRFVNKNRRVTNATDMMIVMEFRNLDTTAAAIARKFHTSDTHVLDVFDKYVRLDRLKLPNIISIDEVFLDMDKYCKYALVIQDFYTGDPIDVLISRRTNVTEPYFASIPPEERNAVTYLISDMYKPYQQMVERYFPNAAPVVDAFHVIQWMVHQIDNYIRSQIKHYKQRDREEYIRRHPYEDISSVTIPVSDEVYMLQKYRWIVLSNRSNITYHEDLRIDPRFHVLMNTYDYEDKLFRISPRLKILRELKELYITFNDRNAGNPVQAAAELDDLIVTYQTCNDSIFTEFSGLLSRYKEPIINSFIMVEKHGNGELYTSRLSNGPIESLNRKVKDLKRLGRGFRNFEHFRNRFLYATRTIPVINGISDSHQVQYFDNNDDDYYCYEEDSNENL